MNQDEQDLTGTVLGTYALRQVLGGGAFATVYLADDIRPQLARPVAVKVLRSVLADDQGFRERFLRESAVVARLDHCPSIVPVYDAGDDRGRLYIAMRYVEGQDLGALIETGAVATATYVDLLEQIADALDVAHQAGLIHRDVKPGNILLSPDLRRAFLADFGITKDTTATATAAMTQQGGYLGTPYYSAPEQFSGSELTGAADVYALTAVSFHALAGRPPFDGPVESILGGHITQDPPSLSALRPDLPWSVDEVIRRGLAKRPEHRYRTAGDFASALRWATEVAPASPQGPLSVDPSKTLPGRAPAWTPPPVGSDPPGPPLEPPPEPPAPPGGGRGGRRRRRLPMAIGLAIAVVVGLALGAAATSVFGADSDEGGGTSTTTAAPKRDTDSCAGDWTAGTKGVVASHCYGTAKLNVTVGTDQYDLEGGSCAPSDSGFRAEFGTEVDDTFTGVMPDWVYVSIDRDDAYTIFNVTLDGTELALSDEAGTIDPGDTGATVTAKDGSRTISANLTC